ERIAALIDGAGLERRQDEVTRELFAQIEHVRAQGSARQRAIAHVVELLALAEIHRHGDDLGAVFFSEPWNGDRSLEAAGVRENDLRHILRGDFVPAAPPLRALSRGPIAPLASLVRSLVLALRDRREHLLDRLCGRHAAAHEENRVVAAERAGDLLKLRAVDPLREALGLAAIGTYDEHRIHALEAAHHRLHGALEVVVGAGLRGAGPDVGAVTRALDQP